jgi:hypothetical protein
MIATTGTIIIIACSTCNTFWLIIALITYSIREIITIPTLEAFNIIGSRDKTTFQAMEW